MYSTADFKKGLKVLYEGQPYSIVDFQHVKPGKGNQFTRTKMKNMLSGSNLEKTFKSGEKFDIPDVMTRECNFLYLDDNGYNFMDTESYDQYCLDPSVIGDQKNYLIENLSTVILFFNGKAIGVDVPITITLKVTETTPSLKGNTVTGGSKAATLQTGLVVTVPLHINEGELLRVDTRTGEYLERASS
jgi:elongation factor P